MKKLIALALLIALIFSFTSANTEKKYTQAWVLCQPDSYINVRAFPKKTSEVIGRLFSGDYIYVDGKTKKGFAHCDVAVEGGEGWVYKGFLVYSEPIPDGHVYPIEAKGRVACRRDVNGTRRCWVHNGDPVRVYMISDEWCLTNKGFIKTKFIDLTTRLDISEPTDPATMSWEEE